MEPTGNLDNDLATLCDTVQEVVSHYFPDNPIAVHVLAITGGSGDDKVVSATNLSPETVGELLVAVGQKMTQGGLHGRDDTGRSTH